MNQWQLAQVNIARAKDDLDSPLLQGFVDRLDEINALADRAPGFVWRLQTEDGDATSIQAFDNPRAYSRPHAVVSIHRDCASGDVVGGGRSLAGFAGGQRSHGASAVARCRSNGFYVCEAKPAAIGMITFSI